MTEFRGGSHIKFNFSLTLFIYLCEETVSGAQRTRTANGQRVDGAFGVGLMWNGWEEHPPRRGQNKQRRRRIQCPYFADNFVQFPSYAEKEHFRGWWQRRKQR